MVTFTCYLIAALCGGVIAERLGTRALLASLLAPRRSARRPAAPALRIVRRRVA